MAKGRMAGFGMRGIDLDPSDQGAKMAALRPPGHHRTGPKTMVAARPARGLSPPLFPPPHRHAE
ncbi:hypothetical protein E2C01_091597 [Portunus trituberculatus]|uniref:Uncharacterized protein n=1 Tax=Portunus trituberculatus TaxID=210409 RepID=A0A5B7JEC7_PORTR|nr:hypothetical protein [Portunus trituberculatus]